MRDLNLINRELANVESILAKVTADAERLRVEKRAWISAIATAWSDRRIAERDAASERRLAAQPKPVPAKDTSDGVAYVPGTLAALGLLPEAGKMYTDLAGVAAIVTDITDGIVHSRGLEGESRGSGLLVEAFQRNFFPWKTG